MPRHSNLQKLMNVGTGDMSLVAAMPEPNKATMCLNPHIKVISLISLQGQWGVCDTDDNVFRMIAGFYDPLFCIRAIKNNTIAAGTIVMDLDETTAYAEVYNAYEERNRHVTRIYLEQATTVTNISLFV